MDAMQLAQLKRQAEWYAEQVRHSERDLQTAELALEGDKKKVEQLRKKLTESKQRLDVYKQDVVRGEDEVRKKIAENRQH